MQSRAPSLSQVAADLQQDRLHLSEFLSALCDRIEAREPELQALLPETDRRERLLHDARELQERFPDCTARSPLFGIPVGVKDIFQVEGYATRAGSRLPPERFEGPEASCVTSLRQAGALILGKTVTTEFACFAPGPTRNPHRPTHTPSGSSSGSAAAVAAGYCPLALGSQTIGSVIRPAAFCGVVGFKPTFGGVPMDAVVPVAPSLDHVGFFTPDAAGLDLAASVLVPDWKSAAIVGRGQRPIVAVPTGPYLAQASSEALAAFEQQVVR